MPWVKKTYDGNDYQYNLANTSEAKTPVEGFELTDPNDPDCINQTQYMEFKVRRYKGGMFRVYSDDPTRNDIPAYLRQWWTSMKEFEKAYARYQAIRKENTIESTSSLT